MFLRETLGLELNAANTRGIRRLNTHLHSAANLKPLTAARRPSPRLPSSGSAVTTGTKCPIFRVTEAAIV